jgi:hypothetical protein
VLERYNESACSFSTSFFHLYFYISRWIIFSCIEVHCLLTFFNVRMYCCRHDDDNDVDYIDYVIGHGDLEWFELYITTKCVFFPHHAPNV